MMNFARIVLITFFLSLLVSCATTNRQSVVTTTNTKTQLAQTGVTDTQTTTITSKGSPSAANATVQSWQLNGKIAVQTAKNSGSADVTWNQRHASYNIAILAPLSGNNLRLSGRPGRVTMQGSDGKQYSAASAESLLAERWGFRVPVSNLKYWVRGLPVPGVPEQGSQHDGANRLTSLTQQGWHVQFLGYTTVNNHSLPNKIFISSPALKVKIVVYHWSL